MSDNTSGVPIEQSKVTSVTREKNPKRVEAGKKLAELNRTRKKKWSQCKNAAKYIVPTAALAGIVGLGYWIYKSNKVGPIVSNLWSKRKELPTKDVPSREVPSLPPSSRVEQKTEPKVETEVEKKVETKVPPLPRFNKL